MSDLRGQAGQVLSDITSADGVVDAIIVTRDGLIALGDLRSGDGDTVAAMAAASLAAAETAGLELGAGRVGHLAASCTGSELLVAGLNDQYILVLLADKGDAAVNALESAQKQLKTALAK